VTCSPLLAVGGASTDAWLGDSVVTKQPRPSVAAAETVDNIGRPAQLALAVEKLLSATPYGSGARRSSPHPGGAASPACVSATSPSDKALRVVANMAAIAICSSMILVIHTQHNHGTNQND
jgi:hypothetical protein